MRYADIIETYTYDRQLPIRSGARRGISRRNALEVWTMMETIHYHPRNSRANAKTTLCALQWYSEGLSPLTLTELTTLYFLLSPTKTTKRLSKQDTKISALLSKLSDINTKSFPVHRSSRISKAWSRSFPCSVLGSSRLTFETERQTRTIARLWGHGFVYMKMTDGNQRLSSYLTKYMAKSFTDYRLMNQKAYVRSRNLIKPVIASVSNFGHAFLDEAGAGTPEIDKSYDTHWLGRGRHRIYKVSDENSSEKL